MRGTADGTNSRLGFWVRYLTFSGVSGTFTRWSADISWDPDHLASSSVSVTVGADSIKTDSEVRDAQLRNHFLEAARYPTITFQSRSVSAGDGSRVRVRGDLCLRGHTGELELEVDRLPEEDGAGTVARFAFRAVVPRKAYGVHWNPAFDFVPLFIGHDVHVEGEVRVTEAAGR